MEQIVNVIVQNGLGVASFIALIYFMNTSLKDMNDNMSDISKTLLLIQANLSSLQNRIDEIEERNK